MYRNTYIVSTCTPAENQQDEVDSEVSPIPAENLSEQQLENQVWLQLTALLRKYRQVLTELKDSRNELKAVVKQWMQTVNEQQEETKRLKEEIERLKQENERLKK